MYLKKWVTNQILRKTEIFWPWVKWKHHPEGKTHCNECLMLDGCFFTEEKAPMCPHHPNCHCTLEQVDFVAVLEKVRAVSDYRKFDPYLFNTQGRHPHGKEKLFKEWGYTVEDARWLQAEIERQGKEKYVSGQYLLGRLNGDGQRISIRIELPRKNGDGIISFLTGWKVYPEGEIKLTTPYGGK